MAASPAGVQFVFDAGPTARVYLRDVATRNVRAILARFPGFVHAPSTVQAEVTAAWLQAVREGHITWAQYHARLAQFDADVRNGVVQVWADDDLLPAVVALQERVTRMHLANTSGVPVLHTHDAYYVALVETLIGVTGERVILVTNDTRVWRCARALGLEVFHGNTCDLGRGVLHVGLPGHTFPEGANCAPCAHPTCPSGFVPDLVTLPPHLGSGIPLSGRSHTAQTHGSGGAQPP